MIDGHLEQLKNTLVAQYGEKGLQWWNDLPLQVERIAQTYKLVLYPPYKELSFNYVLPVSGPHQEAWVLKLGVPNEAIMHEVHALTHYNGSGSIQLIHSHAEEGWMILERCVPGTRLVDLHDEAEAISIAVSVMQQLWKPVLNPQDFLSLSEWMCSLSSLDDDLLKALVPKKLREFVQTRTRELLQSQEPSVLLHGDLHHYNILQQGEQWIAIDPKGVVGEKEFDIGALLRNPLRVIEEPQAVTDLERNFDFVLELTGFDRQKVLSWCVIQAVLSVCWYVEDGMNSKAHQLSAYAERLYSLFRKE